MNLLTNIIFSTFLLCAHPVHLTVTNIEYNNSSKSFDISIRLFVKDFTTILSQNNNQEIILSGKDINSKNKTFITKYITDNLKLNINNKQISKNKYVLKEEKIEDITIWLTYNIKFKDKISKIEITNTLMTDLYRDQKNMLIFTYNKKQSALEFSRKETTNTLKF